MNENENNKKEKLSMRETLGNLADSIGDNTSAAVEKAKGMVSKSKDSVVKVVDVNKDGTVDIEDFIILGLKLPFAHIDRGEFLRKEFTKKYPKEVVDDAIAYNPAHAQIPTSIIDEIADDVIQYERNCVSGISAALSMPGGFTAVATMSADLTQYYGYMLRVAQKLMYLYGFPAIDTSENSHHIDTETMNILIMCLGVMYGVYGTRAALRAMAAALSRGVEKKLLNAALTKGALYPIVRKVATWFGANMTKKSFAGFFGKAIPVVGGVLGGGMTYLSFKPCCDKLKASLQDTYLSNPEHHADEEEAEICKEIIDVE